VPKEILNKEPSTIQTEGQKSPVLEPEILDQKPSEVNPSLNKSVLDANSYVKEQVRIREQARVAEKPGIIAKTKSFLSNIKTKLVDFSAPIEDVLSKSIKENKIKLLPEDNIHNQIDRVLRSTQIASRFAEDNGMVDVIKSVPNIDHLDQYLIAKHAVELDTRGIETGRDLAKDKALVAASPEYEPYAQKINDYSRKLLDYSVESGLISKDVAETLKARYPDYVPFQRVFNELEKSGGQGGTKGVASLSKQTVVQRIEGSGRAIESPIESLLAKTYDAVKQGEKNIAGKMLAGYEKLPGNPFELVPLRTTENVTNRIELYSEAKDLKPLQKKAEKILNTNVKELSRLEREVNNLNKQGLKEYLNSKPQDVLPQKVSSIETKNIPGKEPTMYFDKNDIPTRGNIGTPDKTVLKDELIVLNKREAKSYIEQLIQDENIDLKNIKRKIAGREPKVANLITEVEKMREEFLGIKELRGGLMDEASLLRDAESRGKSTITFFDNGVKNIYETTPEIAEAAKALNVQQLNILGKIMAFPTRVARIGITGLNLPFIGANIAKDQITAFINSSHSLRGSLANPSNFLKALTSAVGHGELYKEMIRAGGGGTSFDLARNQVTETVSSIRATRNPGSMIWYTVKHPGELLTAVENIIGRGEEFTRMQQYSAAKEGSLKAGLDQKNAQIEGARAYRESTVNFARKGEWGTVLNSAFLYINAGIQGTRTLLRNLKDRPIQTAAKIAVTAMLPVAYSTANNLSDPEKKKVYDDIAEYEKENNLIIITDKSTKDDKGKWNVIKIPLSQEINSLVGMVRRPIEAMYGMDPVGFKDFAKAFLGTVSPIAPEKGAVLSTLTPQAIKPTIEGSTNTNLFTGYPQVSQGLERLPVDKQVKPYTSGTARQIAGQLNVSPIKVEEFIKGTFGGLGSQALNVIDKVLAKAGVIPSDQIGGQDILDAITARFSKAQGGAIANKEYAIELIADQVKAAKRADFKSNVYDKAQTLLGEGKNDEADALVQGLSEEDQKMYVNIRTGERSKNTENLHDLLKKDPVKAVQFVRSQNEREKKRLVERLNDDNSFSDAERNLYVEGKKKIESNL
jgi:hypothetical protein